MKFSESSPNTRRHLAAIAVVFLISRAVYHGLGVVFVGDTFLTYWQFVDPHLLQTDLWRSIFYLHSQPPLFNLLTGLVLQIFPSAHQIVFHLFFALCGLTLAACMYYLGKELGLSARVSLALASIFIVSPSTILYENWFTYGYPLAACLTLAGVALFRFARTGHVCWGFLFFLLLSFHSLTWSAFHLVWFAAIFCVLLFAFETRRLVLLSAALPLLLTAGWYAKNWVVFGEFAASTWGGMNLSNVTTFRLPEEERLSMIESGKLSMFAKYPPFRSPKLYLSILPRTPETGIPVLDEVLTSSGEFNRHHLVYIEASNHYLRDALSVIRARPAIYGRGILQSFYLYFHSASDYKLLGENRAAIRAFDAWWNRLLLGQWRDTETSAERLVNASPAHVAWWVVFAFLVIAVNSPLYLWRERERMASPKYLLIFFMSFNVLFITAVGNAAELGENNRFRFVVDPFILLLFFFFASKRLKSGQILSSRSK